MSFRFIEHYSQMGSGRVNQAFAGALTEVLKDYYIFVAQLERQHRIGQLTLNKVSGMALELVSQSSQTEESVSV